MNTKTIKKNSEQKIVTNGTNITTTDYLDGFQTEVRGSRMPVGAKATQTSNNEQYLNGVLLSAQPGSFAKIFLKDFLTLRPPYAEGYVKNTVVSGQNTYDYVYNYTDHLGNIRVSYAIDPLTGELDILEENHYYPFGLKHRPYAGKQNIESFNQDTEKGIMLVDNNNDLQQMSLYKYKYNDFGGKSFEKAFNEHSARSAEFQDELGLNLYGMDVRGYDPAIGRFNVIDPMAAYAPPHTPYRFGFNNPVYWADPSGLYEINSTDTHTHIILNKSEMEAYQAMVDSGSLDGLSGQDLVDAIVDGLEAAGFTNDYTLGEATIKGSAKSGNSGLQYAFSNQCIVGCHQTPGMQRGNTGNPFFRKTESEKFYWFSGGKGEGFDNPFRKPGDLVEYSDLLEWLSISRLNTPSSMETQAIADIFTLVQLWELSGSNGSPIEILGPTIMHNQNDIIKFEIGVANPTNSQSRGFAPYAEGIKTIEVQRKDSAKTVKEAKQISDSIRNLPWPK